MVGIKQFIKSKEYLDNVTKLAKLATIDLNVDNVSENLINIHKEMLCNSGLTLEDIKKTLNDELDKVLIFSKNRILNQRASDDDFFQGYEYEETDKPKLISSYYPVTVLISFLIDYILITKYDKKYVMNYLKKQKINSRKEFYDELISYLPVNV